MEYISPIPEEEVKVLGQLFAIQKSDGSFRPIFDAKEANAYFAPKKFPLAGIAREIRGKQWHAKVDLKDCYLHFDIHKDLRSFLCFKFEGKFYRWNKMPFGWNAAPNLCVALLRPIIRDVQ